MTTAFRSASSRYIAWRELIAKARLAPGEWMLALPNASIHTVKAVHDRRHPDLRLPDGRLEATSRNEYEDEYGLRKADIYVKFVPNK